MFQLVIVPLILAVWGIAVKYWPFLERVPNNLIPWINTALAILLKIAIPEPAHAGGWGNLGGWAHSLGWLLPMVQAAIARAMWQTWGRPTLDQAKIRPVGYETSDAAFDHGENSTGG